jgi:hypothetical protein
MSRNFYTLALSGMPAKLGASLCFALSTMTCQMLVFKKTTDLSAFFSVEISKNRDSISSNLSDSLLADVENANFARD